MNESEKKWVLSLIRDDLLPKPVRRKRVKIVKPKSQIQAYLRDIYEAVRDAESPDALDVFYKDKEIHNYSQKGKLGTFLKEVAEKLEWKRSPFPYDEEDFQKFFFRLCEAKLEDPETVLGVLKDVIEAKYPNLIGDIKYDVAENDMEFAEAEGKAHAIQQIRKIEDQLEKNAELYKDKLAQIETVKKTTLEKIAESLNERLILGEDTWKLMLYGVLSPYASKPLMNGIPVRSCIHTMLIGDVSSGKSTAFRLLEETAPKTTKITKITEATFEGVADRSGIQEGIISKANNGVLIITDFDKLSKEFTILREAMDCQNVVIAKFGDVRVIDVNVVCFASANPKNDFFLDGENLREQITFKEGILSRFDITLPLIVSPAKNEVLLSQIVLFDDMHNDLTLNEIKQTLETLSKGMRTVKRVTLNQDQKNRLKETFLAHNKVVNNRPLLVLRDLETLVRLVNVIVTVNFYDREGNDVIQATDDDLDEAIALFETLITLRERLMKEQERFKVLTPKEIILKEIVQNGKSDALKLQKQIVETMKLCGRSTFYKYVTELVNEQKIVKNGMRESELVPLLS